jgi:arylsulfatase A-like enzyme
MNSSRRLFLKQTFGFMLGMGLMPAVVTTRAARKKKTAPNIVYILADDMGIDSVSALNSKSGVATPNINKLIRQGMTFTDAHSGSAVCSPTRYGVLTGRYSWRTRMKSGIVNKWGPPLIAEDRLTVGKLLQKAGYHTGCIGKWHLGWQWHDRSGEHTTKAKEVDFSKRVTGGPIERGFDCYFGDDVPNWPPFVWIENNRVIGIPTATMKADSSNGVSSGPAMAGWRFEAVLPTITEKCVGYITERSKREESFFLYFAMTSPHTPINPSERFQGKSGVSKYADFLMETDWSVGRIMRTLDDLGLAENTLVIFTADNGTSPKCDFVGLEQKNVHLRDHWRGHKADIWEGGHRVPFVARWPGVIKPGSKCEEVITLVDFMATAAEIVGTTLPDDAGEDSVSLLGLFQGRKSDRSGREGIVCHSSNGYFAVREGRWKIEFCPGSGGWSAPKGKQALKLGLPRYQLYDLVADPKEQNNLYEKKPEVAGELIKLLRRYVTRGRSTAGTTQTNEGPEYWKQLPW